jgi:hypothetical protein
MSRFRWIVGVVIAGVLAAVCGGAFASANAAKHAPGHGKVARRGPRGARGPRGQDGAQGPQGPAGEPGKQGERGATGSEGPAGKQGTEGTQGVEGKQGAQGLEGKQGERGAEGAAGGARAYALVNAATIVSCGCGCGTCPPPPPPPHITRGVNIEEGSKVESAPPGTWCLRLSKSAGIVGAAAVVVVSTTEPLRTAVWNPEAPDCDGTISEGEAEIEIQTYAYKMNGGELVAEHAGEITFSLVVP